MSHIRDRLIQLKNEVENTGNGAYFSKNNISKIVELLFTDLEQDEKENDWIPVSERLPEECMPVNIVWINRNPETYYSKIKDVPFSATGVYYNGNWYWYSSTCVDYLVEYGKCERDLIDKAIDITHWQPLPRPLYKEDWTW
jgi:hypothetical protein